MKKNIKIDYSTIKNILFDLGNVVINIDFELTDRAFAHLLDKTLSETQELMLSKKIYDVVERRPYTDDQFADFINESFSSTFSTQKIVDSWNALLLDIPAKRIELILALREKYQVMCLSNTSTPHIEECNQILARVSKYKSLEEVFDKTYYSYDMGLRKPSDDIYKQVLEKSEILASETLFLDDNLANIEAAKQLGFSTILVEKNICITEYLKDA